MRQVLKWTGIGVGTVAVVLAVAVGAIYALSNARMTKPYTVAGRAPALPSGAAALAEGKRLFISRGCVDCHGMDLAGQIVVDDPAIGHFAGANLTAGKGGVGGTLSDADFDRAIRHGVAPGGRPLIFMPSTDYSTMSDSDLGTIVAYIRSAAPVDRPAPEQRPGPVARLLFLAGKFPLLVTAELIDHTQAPVDVKPGITLEYGRYLANGCTGCHGFGFSGGPIPGGNPDWPPAENITPDPATGLAKWSEADFLKAVRTGERPDGRRIRPPMPWNNFALLTDTEVKALWMYLKTVPAKAYGGR